MIYVSHVTLQVLFIIIWLFKGSLCIFSVLRQATGQGSCKLSSFCRTSNRPDRSSRRPHRWRTTSNTMLPFSALHFERGGGREEGQGVGTGPSFFETTNTSAWNFNNQGLRYSWSWRCPGTSALRVPHQMVLYILCSFGCNAWGKLRALEGHRDSSKSPSRSEDKGVCY